LTYANRVIGRILCGIGIKIIPVVMLALTVASSAAAASGDKVQVRRYLLSAGANNGGKERVMLRYAVTDAKAFASVLIEMGGVEKNNALILANPNSRELIGGIENLNRLIAGNKDGGAEVKNEVFVYYSGHADIDGLKLGSETLPWADFRNAVNGINAEVRVAVLDACGSGAITRTKGGIARPAFLSDASSDMKGYAFLTSSNENEVSQESDRIKGSYFTHALLSGMRGAADLTGDGRVTINEAYQYAFNETLQNTQNTSAGTQHPSRDMNLAGTGDIVMTDLRVTSAILSLNEDIEGRFFIRDENGNLFAELRKMRGRAIDLGITPGKYTVQMEAPSRRWVADNVVISEGKKTTLTMNDMTAMPLAERTTRRGNVYDGFEDDGEDLDGDDGSAAGPNDLRDPPVRTAASSPSLSDSRTSTEASADTSAQPAASQSNTTAVNAPCSAGYALNMNIIGLSVAVGSGTGIDFHPFSKGCGIIQAGIVNMADSVEYIQGGALNIANRVGYIQGGVVNMAQNVEYLQGGTVNIATKIGYFQGGPLNIADSVGYFQAGSVNAANKVGYFQAGPVNVANYVGYLQAGAVNIASEAGYVQAGAVNIAGKVKRQIGVVNIAGYSEDTPIGLVNIIGNGIFYATFYGESDGGMGATLRTGTPRFYTTFDYTQPIGDFGLWPKQWGLGVGSRFPFDTPLFINLDLAWSDVHYGSDYDTYTYTDRRPLRHLDTDGRIDDEWLDDWRSDDMISLRLGINYAFTSVLAVTAGVSVNTMVEGGFGGWGLNRWLDWGKNPLGKNSAYNDWTAGSRNLRTWPAFYAGLTLGKVYPSAKKTQDAD